MMILFPSKSAEFCRLAKNMHTLAPGLIFDVYDVAW